MNLRKCCEEIMHTKVFTKNMQFWKSRKKNVGNNLRISYEKTYDSWLADLGKHQTWLQRQCLLWGPQFIVICCSTFAEAKADGHWRLEKCSWTSTVGREFRRFWRFWKEFSIGHFLSAHGTVAYDYYDDGCWSRWWHLCFASVFCYI